MSANIILSKWLIFNLQTDGRKDLEKYYLQKSLGETTLGAVSTMGNLVVGGEPMMRTFWSQSTKDKALNTTPETTGDFHNAYELAMLTALYWLNLRKETDRHIKFNSIHSSQIETCIRIDSVDSSILFIDINLMFLMCIGGQMTHLIPDDPECCVFCIGLRDL